MMGQGKGTASRVASQGKQKKVGGKTKKEEKTHLLPHYLSGYLVMLELWRWWQQERSMERQLATWKSESCFIFLVRKFLKKTGSLGLYFGFSGYRSNPVSQVQSSQLVLFFLILFCFFPY